ncbi:HNH endonuclease [Haloplanus salilacus]|uniref:HNH endonuclease n=1 Tax=Haloplanus salilacus TaxID=2949994 RepID=UPI0030D0689B
MSAEEAPIDFDPSYVAGLFDTVGRVRFDISETPQDGYTVRPMLRLSPHQTQLRAAVIGEFLEERGYRYDFIEREYGDEFFRLQRRTDLEDLQSFLDGRSAHLIRELAFVDGVFADQFDFDILDPVDVYRFTVARDELRHGWRPKGRYHVSPDDISDRHDVETDDVETPALPHTELRTGYTVEWIAGVYDGVCRYRASIAEASDYEIGYAMYPIARLHRSGVCPTFVNAFRQFCEDYDLTYGDSSGKNDLQITFTGASNVRRILDVLYPRLLVLAEASEGLVEGILPAFDENVHRDKRGFYDLLREFDRVAELSGGPFRHREYDPEYFADLWRDELDLVDRGTVPSHSGTRPEDELDQFDEVTVPPGAFGTTPRRFRTLVDRVERDPDRVARLKSLYDDRCQLCGTRLASSDGTGYSEVHHLRPLEAPHGGSDVTENMLVLCPNHHVDFDNGVVRVHVDDLSVDHPYDSAVDGDELFVTAEHEPAESALRYHNRTICRLR